MKKLALFTICLLTASMAFAKGSVKIVNNLNHSIEVYAYDWDDGVRAYPTDHGDIDPGKSYTVTCVKGLFDPNAPGCWVGFTDHTTGEILTDNWQKKNGTWYMTGSYDLVPDPDRPANEGAQIVVNKNIALTPQAGGSDVSIFKTQLPLPAGGTSDCIQIGTEATLLDNKILHLKWQLDGNLVLSANDGSGSVWWSGTNPDATHMCFQGDGNLVIYRSSHGPWATGTNSNGNELRLQSDCNLVIYDSGGKSLWASGTYGCP